MSQNDLTDAELAELLHVVSISRYRGHPFVTCKPAIAAQALSELIRRRKEESEAVRLLRELMDSHLDHMMNRDLSSREQFLEANKVAREFLSKRQPQPGA